MGELAARKLSLYDLTSDFDKLMQADTDDEITAALIEFEAGEIERKAENICKFVTTLESTAAQFKAEEQRIASARKALENKADRMRERMKECLLNANIMKVDAGTYKVSVAMTGGSVAIDDQGSIPARFFTIVPEQYVPNKTAIKDAIKSGEEVAGAHIEAGFSLRIK